MKKMNIGCIPGNGTKYCLLRVSPLDNHIVIGKKIVTGEYGVVLDKDTAKRGTISGDNIITGLLYGGYCRSEIDFETPYISFGPFGLKEYYAAAVGDKAYLLSSKVDKSFIIDSSATKVSKETFEEMIKPKEGERVFYITDAFKVFDSIEIPTPNYIIEKYKSELLHEYTYYTEDKHAIAFYDQDNWTNVQIRLDCIREELNIIKLFEEGKQKEITLSVDNFNPLYVLRYSADKIILDEYFLTTIDRETFSIVRTCYLLGDTKKYEGKIKRI